MKAENVDLLVNQVVSLKKQPLADLAIHESESPWTTLVSTERVIHAQLRTLVERAFAHGGYVAGGFARHAALRDIGCIERGVYVQNGGDLDLFFRSREGWLAFLAETREREDVSCRLSRGSLAANLEISVSSHPPKKDFLHGYNKPFPVQAIGCAFGEPAELIRGFDFVNCAFAFDADRAWSAELAWDLEVEEQLGVLSWDSRSLVHRLIKYVDNHGYKKVTSVEASPERRTQQLISSLSSDPKRRSYDGRQWLGFLSSRGNVLDLQTYVDIATCCVLPSVEEVDRASLQNLIADHTKVRTKWKLTLDNIKASLLERESSIGIPIEDYCWTI